jgi:type II secretion system protein H
MESVGASAAAHVPLEWCDKESVGAHSRAPSVDMIKNALGITEKNESAANRRDKVAWGGSPRIRAFFTILEAPKGRDSQIGSWMPEAGDRIVEVRMKEPAEGSHLLSRQGITLLELLVVITLIAIVGALVYPSFGNALSNLRLRGIARETVALCRLAKYEAVTHRQPYHLVADLEQNMIRVTDSAQQVIKELDFPPGIRVFQVQVLSENGPTDASQLYFFPNGAAEPGTITLRDEGGRNVKIVIDLLTGDATIPE